MAKISIAEKPDNHKKKLQGQVTSEEAIKWLNEQVHAQSEQTRASKQERANKSEQARERANLHI